jgi:hypothetical protein
MTAPGLVCGPCGTELPPNAKSYNESAVPKLPACRRTLQRLYRLSCYRAAATFSERRCRQPQGVVFGSVSTSSRLLPRWGFGVVSDAPKCWACGHAVMVFGVPPANQPAGLVRAVPWRGAAKGTREFRRSAERSAPMPATCASPRVRK